MEKVLDVYEKPLDLEFPVVCFDERPCQLLGDVMQPTLPEPGRSVREDYHYERNGTAVVLAAVEPLTGERMLDVRERKTKIDYTEFMKNLSKKYSDAKKIILVQDNLNTHTPSSFYESMPAEEAFALSERFHMIYTPKKASWLNMAEIEFSALSKQCLDRRIPTLEKLQTEVKTWTKKRNKLKVKINWQFTKTKAREKFERHYKKILQKNQDINK
jgi:hypothetical protein